MTSAMQQIQSRGKLRVGVFAHIPKYSLWNEKEYKMEGFEADLGRLLAEELFGNESHVEFITLKEVEAIDAIKENRVDIAICHLTITPSRAELIDFSKPYLIEKILFLVRKDSSIRCLSDLKGKKISAGKGRSTVENLKNYFPAINLVETTSSMDAINDVLNKKIDAYSCSQSFMIMRVKEFNDSQAIANSADRFRIVGAENEERFLNCYIAIGVKKDCPDLVRFINAFLTKIEADGTLRKIKIKHDIEY